MMGTKIYTTKQGPKKHTQTPPWEEHQKRTKMNQHQQYHWLKYILLVDSDFVKHKNYLACVKG